MPPDFADTDHTQLDVNAAPLAPGLYLVPTPLGNLEDITMRALRVLRGADVILAEDTRRTRILLDRYEIKKPCEPYHDFNKEKVEARYLERLRQDQIVALVSDAGTPGIADPAFNLVRAALTAALPVHSLPGAVALTTALVASGLPTDRFFFDYFPAKKSAQRKRRFESLRDRFADDHHAPTLAYYVSPYQIIAVVDELAAVFGPDLKVVIGRELTKKFEEFLRGTALEVGKRLKSRTPKGEFVLLFHPGNKGGATSNLDEDDEGEPGNESDEEQAE
jgi:16S rRNA (cytidine1402-2'-O)-methyltransferase